MTHRQSKAKANDRRKRTKREPKWKIEANQIESITSQYSQMNQDKIEKFSDIPLSHRTQEGLRKNGYSTPTDIQRAALPVALIGKDILGAAKTGSGKTLAFLIPVLELLWRERWSHVDGLGGLIISPTRELAYQTFEVLRKVGTHHDFSAGLVIGGKDLDFERGRILSTNIIICTPGRLLQHMDETPNFECQSLKILVLDEADRILDLGFRRTMESVIANLPSQRQTLLFSATQTKSIQDLALLSLSSPEHISVHEQSTSSTPSKLSQSYVICNLEDKMGTLFSFIKNHLQSKCIVFMSSCKQVKFTYEAFRRLRPGVPLMALFGRQNQLKRVAVYEDFCKKKAAILLCTDIASRGLDFPSVHWVLQLDCPEDSNTYIHRVGRTARYEKDGHALLFLLPSELEMVKDLSEKRIPIDEIKIDPKRLLSIQGKLEAFCAQDSDFKLLAQKCFIRYLRSVHLQSNKKIFDVRKMSTSAYALSLGLSQPPRIRFLKKGNNQGKNWKQEEKGSSQEDKGSSQEDEESSDEDSNEEEKRVIVKREEGTTVQEPLKHRKFRTSSFDDDILTVKRVILVGKDNEATPSASSKTTPSMSSKLKSKAKMAKSLLNKKLKLNTHVKFGEDDDDLIPVEEKEEVPSASEEVISLDPVPIDEYSIRDVGGLDIDEAKEAMKVQDKLDRQNERKRIQEAHRRKRLKKRERNRDKDKPVILGHAVLGGSDKEGSDDDEHEQVKRQKVEVESSEEMGNLSDDEELALHLLQKR